MLKRKFVFETIFYIVSNRGLYVCPSMTNNVKSTGKIPLKLYNINCIGALRMVFLLLGKIAHVTSWPILSCIVSVLNSRQNAAKIRQYLAIQDTEPLNYSLKVPPTVEWNVVQMLSKEWMRTRRKRCSCYFNNHAHGNCH